MERGRCSRVEGVGAVRNNGGSQGTGSSLWTQPGSLRSELEASSRKASDGPQTDEKQHFHPLNTQV